MKLFFTGLISFFGLGLFAQTPLEVAVDFSAKDIHGNYITLFEILDQEEKYVLIDFFSVSCVPCQALAPKLDSVYTYFGSNTLNLYVLAIDQNFDNEMVEGFEEEYNTHYPAISGIEGGGSTIYEAYKIPYYPSLILIAPDHTIVEQAIPIPSTTAELIDLLETYPILSSSIEEEFQEGEIKLFPNPTQDFLVLQVPHDQKTVSVHIYSIVGEELFVLTHAITSQPIEINTSDLGGGMYFVSVYFEDGRRFSKSFVKK
jgi:thiol-disulfide isomerase/thioredoxin